MESKIIKCKYCETGNLKWIENDSGGWSLEDIDSGVIHRCKSDNKSKGPKVVSCRKCNESGLKFVLVGPDGYVHKCNK